MKDKVLGIALILPAAFFVLFALYNFLTDSFETMVSVIIGLLCSVTLAVGTELYFRKPSEDKKKGEKK